MGYFTLAHMNVLAKICPPRLSSLVTKLKVGIWLPLALVRATLTDRSHDSRPCSLKVTAELLSTNNWRPLSRQGANILWPGCFGTYECVCKKLSTEIQLSWDQAEGGNLVAVGAGESNIDRPSITWQRDLWPQGNNGVIVYQQLTATVPATSESSLWPGCWSHTWLMGAAAAVGAPPLILFCLARTRMLDLVASSSLAVSLPLHWHKTL